MIHRYLFCIAACLLTVTVTSNAMTPTNTTLCYGCYEHKNNVTECIQGSCSQQCFNCKECLKRSFEAALRDKKVDDFKCLRCNNQLTQQDAIALDATAEQLEQYADYATKQWLMQQNNIKHCPTPNCPYAFINEASCPQTIQCQQCNKKYCSQCLLPHKESVTCKQAAAKLLSQEERETLQWEQQNTKQCPRCKKKIEKNGGCNHMTCDNCRYEFCWICLQQCQSAHSSCRPAAIQHDSLLPNLPTTQDLMRTCLQGIILLNNATDALLEMLSINDILIFVTIAHRWEQLLKTGAIDNHPIITQFIAQMQKLYGRLSARRAEEITDRAEQQLQRVQNDGLEQQVPTIVQRLIVDFPALQLAPLATITVSLSEESRPFALSLYPDGSYRTDSQATTAALAEEFAKQQRLGKEKASVVLCFGNTNKDLRLYLQQQENGALRVTLASKKEGEADKILRVNGTISLRAFTSDSQQSVQEASHILQIIARLSRNEPITAERPAPSDDKNKGKAVVRNS
ncbi:IBR domain-containing protein [Candidatus Dependentiae bacterium]|nr:IBR domain-containing protein [Candidatus Dependentiae bacterium]